MPELDELAQLVRHVATKTPERTESDLQADIKRLLLKLDLNLSESDLRLESPLKDGSRRRLDIEVGHAVIEVKRDLARANVLDEAVQQLAGYVEQRVEQLQSRFVGILTDGTQWLLYTLQDGLLVKVSTFEISPEEPNPERFQVWLEAIFATQQQITPAPDEVARRLGVRSPAYQMNHKELKHLYEAVSSKPEVVLKRHLWARLLRTALGTSFRDDVDLFVDHTLLVMQANMIAHAIIGFDLLDYVNDQKSLLQGVEFKNALIGNVVESDFFDWVLDAPESNRLISSMIRDIRRFNWSRVEHDVLKVLYESIITADTRKSLGEYYTPDWLAQHMVETAIEDPLNQRVLDPACGSGTFLFHAVKRYLAEAEANGVPSAQAIAGLESHVFGLDVHPVSVQLARVTYLLAIGLERLVNDERPAFSVPVYLGDSLQWESSGGDVNSSVLTLKVEASDLAAEGHATLFDIGDTLSFPLSTIEDPGAFDRLVGELADKAMTYRRVGDRYPSIAGLLRSYGLTDSTSLSLIQDTFHLMCDLNAQGKNHIWGYYVRNRVRPLWFSTKDRQVDVLIGNPPWVAYRFMTEAMQQNYQRLSIPRGISSKGQNASNQDLVALFIVRTIEQYLTMGGRFAFVAPRSVLSRPQYEGFRRAAWSSGSGSVTRAAFDPSWDLEKVKPDLFPVPSAVLFGRKAKSSRPLSEDVFAYSGRTRTKSVSWDEARAKLTIKPATVKFVSAASGFISPYGKSVYMGATIRPQVFFFVDEMEAGPLGAGRGRRRVQSSRSSLEKEPWKLLPRLNEMVGRAYLYKVLLGSSILPYRIIGHRTAVLPIFNGAVLDEAKIDEHRDLSKWWSQAVRLWEANKTAKNKLTLLERVNYQRGISTQLGKGRHRVVYSKSGIKLAAARVDDSSYIVEQSLYWLTVPSEAAAQYLTAVINSSVTLAKVEEYQSRGLFGGRDFVKLIWNLPIPRYVESDPLHSEIVDLARQAETMALSVPIPETIGFQRARRMVRDALDEAGISRQIDARVAQLLND